jgi:hypothetical protein
MNDWNYTDQELPEPDTGEQLELWWASGTVIGYFDTGLFKDGSFWIPATVPYGLGFADEGREYKKLIHPDKWRYITKGTATYKMTDNL